MFLLPAIAFSLSSLILFALLKSGVARRLALDQPNQRSLHAVPVPRVGGIAIVAAVLVAWTLQPGSGLLLALLTAVLALVSAVDDRIGLPAALRLMVHGLATLALMPDVGIGNLWLAAGLLAGLVWMTNLYNFMDGADGLAGGMAVIGFSALAAAFQLQGESGWALAAVTVAVAAGGFLLFNWPPARVFMGDAGSVPLGFLAAAFGWLGFAQHLWPVWLPLLLFLPFIADASVTLLRRGLRGEKVWQAHREHYYQRLIRMGWSHRRMALVAWTLMACGAALALLAWRVPAWRVLAFAWPLCLAAGMVWTDRRWRAWQAQADSATR